jgi:hypothetical protein
LQSQCSDSLCCWWHLEKEEWSCQRRFMDHHCQLRRKGADAIACMQLSEL